MNEELQRITQELQKRGIPLNSPETSFESSPETTVDPELATIQEELRRRGVLPQAESQPSEYSWWDRAKQLGGGALSAIQEAAMAQAQADPFARQTPRMKGYIKEAATQHQQEKAKELSQLDPWGRVLHHGGGFGGEMLTTPVPMGGAWRGATTIPKVVSALGKDVLMGSTVGGLSGVAQEMGANPLAADIGAGFIAPGVVGTGKGIKEGAKYLFAPKEQKAARALKKIYSDKAAEIGESRPLQEAFNVPAALEEVTPTMTPTEAGTQLRGTLKNELKARKEFRTSETEPLYEAVKQNPYGHSTPKTHELIDSLLITSKGDTRRAVEEIKKELSSSYVRLTPQQRKNKEYVESFARDNPWAAHQPEIMEKIKKEYPFPSKLDPTVYEIDNVIKDVIDPKLKNADGNLKKDLLGIKESLIQETSSVPQLKEAREKYATLSEPVNKIERHPLLGLAVKKDPYNKSYTFGESDLPKKVIDPSLKSVHHAEDLLTEIKGDKKTLDATKGYINSHLIDHITDGYGKVSHEKLQSWKHKNEGAFVIDPSLNTKIKNLSNSQYLVNQARLKVSNTSLKDTFAHFGVKSASKFLPSFVGKDKIVDLLSFKMAQDIQGKDELIMKVIKSPEFKELLETSPKQTTKMGKFVKALEPAMKNALIAAK